MGVVAGAVDDPQAERKSVTWADMIDEGDRLESPGSDGVRCDHCDKCFQSRNGLFQHLREVGRDSRSTPTGRRSAADGVPQVRPYTYVCVVLD